MTVYGTEVLRALLSKIQEGQIDVSGDEVGVFERLLQLGNVTTFQTHQNHII